MVISNSIKLIHSITKSHPNTKRFNAELLRRGQPAKTLSKPLQIRWNTNQTAISETRAYLDVISAVLGSDDDPETHPLPAFFRSTVNQLRLSLVDYVLQKTVSPLNALQSNSLTFLQSQDTIAHLLHDFEAISAFDLKNEWASIPREDNEEFESSEKLVLEEAVLLLTRLCSELRTKFVENDETAELDFLSHNFLTAPNSNHSDQYIQNIAMRLQRFIPPLLKQHLITQFHHLKSTYQINFRINDKTPSQILDLLLTNPLFSTNTAILQILKVIKTIQCTSVPTEREFSILHHTQRKDRSSLTIDHLQLLTRINHNVPELLPESDVDTVLKLRQEKYPVRKQKRTQSSAIRPIVYDDLPDDFLWDDSQQEEPSEA
ncbi:hypothetical protein BLNAU_6017 [Blattamonas nauphoetae]|uniref:HAT C-terminal dimerisation domain-containing protein n=1 Tax=Blattamonas nauphoetae TaxID=2049346 RepID=A0ABQ9Y5I0_9EUKA|nr:hypothetical protein BLNAU_6017 [Blattamonas nauphoetae]